MTTDRLILVLGDQLSADSAALADLSPERDCVWMAEVAEESTKVWSHKARILLFLSAMRHFAETLRERGLRVDYQALDQHAHADLDGVLRDALQRHRPRLVRLVQPGEYSIAQGIQAVCAEAGVELEVLEDAHFLTSREGFADWSRGRKQWVMEHFYRHARRQTGYLMQDDAPAGQVWNLDKENRRSFGKQGPGMLTQPIGFSADATTREVARLVESRFADHPGSLASFDWPLTRPQALAALDDFIQYRLAPFGPYQDALWSGEPWLYHSRLSAALNLKLLDPREVLDAAVSAYEQGRAPLNSVEGFVRQILGWREYVRHIYWSTMPGLLEANALNAHQPLPGLYWMGETDMACLREAIGQTLEHGFAHHIQRLMVTGLFALLLGVKPRQVHQWYLAVYVDAVEWVEAPNTIGMSQHADGGRLATKPYAASGRYIQRMSNYCEGCRFRPSQSHGSDACPFTTLYWDFLMRHQERFARHPRTALQWRSLDRLDSEEKDAIRAQAQRIRESLA